MSHRRHWSWCGIFAHFPEDILSYSEELVSYLGTVSSLLGLSFFGQPWEQPLSANEHLFLRFFALPLQLQLPLQSTHGLPLFLVCHVDVSQDWICLNAWLVAAYGYGNST